MKTRIILVLFILILLVCINNNTNFKIETFYSNNYFSPATGDLCENVAGSCYTGFDIMCHMGDPINNYSVTALVCDNRGGGNYHKGVDLTRGSGDGKIYAAYGGTVIATTNYNKNCSPSGALLCSPIFCGSSRGISVTIRIENNMFNNFTVHYMHMSSLNVKVGDKVNAGDYIGKIGNTGCSTGEHLHFQINDTNGNAIQISQYFVDKSSYSCGSYLTDINGNIIESDNDNPSTPALAYENILKDKNNNPYKAQIGLCPGFNGISGFHQGIELIINSQETIYVHALSSGIILDNNIETCREGIQILTDGGDVHTYCYMQKGSVKYSEGDYIKKDEIIGIAGNTTSMFEAKKLFFAISRAGKYVDVSQKFLKIYGGQCINASRRYSCSGVVSREESAQCAQMIK